MKYENLDEVEKRIIRSRLNPRVYEIWTEPDLVFDAEDGVEYSDGYEKVMARPRKWVVALQIIFFPFIVLFYSVIAVKDAFVDCYDTYKDLGKSFHEFSWKNREEAQND